MAERQRGGKQTSFTSFISKLEDGDTDASSSSSVVFTFLWGLKRNKRSGHPVYTSAHLSHLCCPLCHHHPPSPILWVIISFHAPRRSNHLDNRWRTRSARPVVLFPSTPAGPQSLHLSIPPSLSLCDRNTTGGKILTDRQRVSVWIHTIINKICCFLVLRFH